MHRFQKNRHAFLFTATAFMMLLFGAMACSVLDSDGDKDGINQPGTPLYPQPYQWPWVSPDGSKLLFSRNAVSLIQQSGTYFYMPDSSGIWLAEPDGSNMRQLIQGIYLDFPSLSPDGQWLLFGAGAQIYKAPFAGDSVDVAGIVQLTTEGRNFFPAWSPEGQWIAYSRSICDGPDTCGIWIMQSDG